jgi:hypothetical protein
MDLSELLTLSTRPHTRPLFEQRLQPHPRPLLLCLLSTLEPPSYGKYTKLLINALTLHKKHRLQLFNDCF